MPRKARSKKPHNDADLSDSDKDFAPPGDSADESVSAHSDDGHGLFENDLELIHGTDGRRKKSSKTRRGRHRTRNTRHASPPIEGEASASAERPPLQSENASAGRIRGPRTKKKDQFSAFRPKNPRKALQLPYHVPRSAQLARKFPLPSDGGKLVPLHPPLTWSVCDVPHDERATAAAAAENAILEDNETALVAAWLGTETRAQILHSTSVDLAEVKHVQLAIHKTAANCEWFNVEARRWCEELLALGVGTFEGDKEELTAALERIELLAPYVSKWRRKCASLRKSVLSVSKKAEKNALSTERVARNKFDALLEQCGFDRTGLHLLPKVSTKTKWSPAEERRLRSALYYYGRDWEKIDRYVRMERVLGKKSKLRSKVQKLFILYRKVALPLPPAVKAMGPEYTLKGTVPVDPSSNIWTETLYDLQDMLPIVDVPFGRREYHVPNEPVTINLVDDDDSEYESSE